MATVTLFKTIIIKNSRYYDISPIGECQVVNFPDIKKNFSSLYPGWEIVAISQLGNLNTKNKKKWITYKNSHDIPEIWNEKSQALFRMTENTNLTLKTLYYNPFVDSKIARNCKGQVKPKEIQKSIRKTFAATPYLVSLIERYVPEDKNERLTQSLINLLFFGIDNQDLIDPILDPCYRLYDIKLTPKENEIFEECAKNYPRVKEHGYNLIGRLVLAGLKAKNVSIEGKPFRKDTGSKIGVEPSKRNSKKVLTTSKAA